MSSSLNNTEYGYGALHSNTSGNNNTAVGAYAAYYFDGPEGIGNNTSIGTNAGFSNTTGGNNTSVGAGCMCNNTTGVDNTAVGSSAMEGVAGESVGNYNVALGAQALYQSQGGEYQTAVGFQSLMSNTTGTYNTAIGSGCMSNNTTGTNNTALGWNALQGQALDQSVGNYNVAVGLEALYNSQEASVNQTAVGYQALASNTSGAYNCAVGAGAMQYNTVGINNVAVGVDALQGVSGQTVGSYNIAIGVQSLGLIQGAQFQTAVGHRALAVNNQGGQDGGSNTALGFEALSNSTTGTYNSAVGCNAGLNDSTGNFNTYLGANSTVVSDASGQETSQWLNSTAIGANAVIGAQYVPGTSAGGVIVMGGMNPTNGLYPDTQVNANCLVAGGIRFGSQGIPLTGAQSGSGIQANGTVTFPYAFAAIPSVVASQFANGTTIPTANNLGWVIIQTISTTGFTYTVINSSLGNITGSTNVTWIAMTNN